MDLFFDASRIVNRLRQPTATGIDRVDVAWLHFLHKQRRCRLVLRLLDGPAALAVDQTDALLHAVELHWGAHAGESRRRLDALADWLARPRGASLRIGASGAEAASPATPFQPSNFHRGIARLRMLAQTRRGLYVHTSHTGADRAAYMRRCRASFAHCLSFVHDTIPIDFPEHSRAGEAERHWARLRNIARTADRILVNSRHTRDCLRAMSGRLPAPLPPLHVLPLGVENCFHVGTPALAPGRPYFVMLGTIEPRKNHALMLDVWAQLVARFGDAAPRLVLLGRRGWNNEALFARLDAPGALAGHIAECAGLDDRESAAVLAGATALLTPSFAEGYNLPLAEALACGTPALASDLDIHREVAGDCARLLPADDARAWAEAIAALAGCTAPAGASGSVLANGCDALATARAAAAAFRPMRWERHFHLAAREIEQLSAGG